MKFPVIWTTYLASRLPCPPSAYSFTREHVLPKSLFPRVVTEKTDNIIPLPSSLNSARGNRKYTNKIYDGYCVYTCKHCPSPGFCPGAMVVTNEGVVPPDVFKGPIARSVLKSIDKFPQFANDIDRIVLDLDVAAEWNQRFPIRLEEASYRSNWS